MSPGPTTPTAKPPRVASLLPSATEMVCAVGLEEALVGVSHECDWPRSVVGRPVLTIPKVFAEALSSGAIDRDVRRILRDALAVYDIDLAALAAAAPDVIVTQDLCDVCAVSFADVEKAARALLPPDVRIVNLHPTRLADIFEDLRRVGRALGREIEADSQVRALLARVDAVQSRVRAARSRTDVLTPSVLTPGVLTIEWLDPVMIGGTWMPELVEIAGGKALVTRPGDHAPTLSRAELEVLAPDVVIVKPCGFDLARTMREIDTLRELFATLSWPAVHGRRVWIADGNAYFNRPGPRIVDSLEILAACIHPEIFPDFAARYRGEFVRLDEAVATAGA